MFSVGMTLGSLGSILVPISHTFHLRMAQVSFPVVFNSSGFLVGTLIISFAWRMTRARSFLTIFSIINAICMLMVFFWHTNFTLILTFLFISGMAGAVIHSGLDSLFAELYPHDRSRALNFLHVFFGLGAFTGPFIIGTALALSAPWYLAFLFMGLLCIPWPFLFVRRSLYHRIHALYASRLSDIRPRAGSLWSHPIFWVVFATIFIYVGTEGCLTSWSGVFLNRVRGLSASFASYSVALIWMMIVVGRLIFSHIIRPKTLSLFLIIASLGNVVGTCLFFMIKSTYPEMFLIGLAGLNLSFMYPGLIALGGDLFPDLIGMVIGTLAASGTMGSIFFPWILGPLAERMSLARSVFIVPFLALFTAILLIFVYQYQKKEAEKHPGK
ncbi:MAG: MFS transporter [Candidatus Atribacteria bacterium]|nr:MFS transporter [Candidatus Atribacteria bacterium]